MHRLAVVFLALAALAPAAHAHHRQTPAVVPITTGGEATLPRLAPPGRKAVAVAVNGTVAVVEPFRNPLVPAFAFLAGTNANPSIGIDGRTMVWDSNADPLGTGMPGRQIVSERRSLLAQPVADPSGTSNNPGLDPYGLGVAFESTADLAATGNPGARQVFHQAFGGLLRQISRGVGTSANATIGLRGRAVAFESTSHPTTGADTGVAQIWVANLPGGTAAPVTAGLGPSTQPAFSNDGRIVAFQSEADLAGDNHDTHTPQIFVYDTVSQTFARLTDEPTGCTGANAARVRRDWRITYTCGGIAYFTMLRTNTRFRVQTDGGDTTRIDTQGETFFVLVATTADLINSGTTPDHRVYMVNLYKRPPELVQSDILWFPSQGISSL